MSRQVSIFPSKHDLLKQTLKLILDKAESAIAQQGRFTIALAGGNTPKPLYEQLAQTPQDWEHWHIFWGDERFVPSDHPDSNERMAREAWLNQISIPPENIHPFVTTASTAELAAVENEDAFKTFWNLPGDQWPSLDFVLLGMGDDGHTASLFPETEALQICDRWVTVGNKGENLRLTLTIPILNQAKTIALLIAGSNKNTILKEILMHPSAKEKISRRVNSPSRGHTLDVG